MVMNVMNNSYCIKAIQKNDLQSRNDRTTKKSSTPPKNVCMRSKSCEKEITNIKNNESKKVSKGDSIPNYRTKSVDEAGENERRSSMPKLINDIQRRKRSRSKENLSHCSVGNTSLQSGVT